MHRALVSATSTLPLDVLVENGWTGGEAVYVTQAWQLYSDVFVGHCGRKAKSHIGHTRRTSHTTHHLGKKIFIRYTTPRHSGMSAGRFFHCGGLQTTKRWAWQNTKAPLYLGSNHSESFQRVELARSRAFRLRHFLPGTRQTIHVSELY